MAWHTCISKYFKEKTAAFLGEDELISGANGFKFKVGDKVAVILDRPNDSIDPKVLVEVVHNMGGHCVEVEDNVGKRESVFANQVYDPNEVDIDYEFIPI